MKAPGIISPFSPNDGMYMSHETPLPLRIRPVFTCWRTTGASFLPVSFKLNLALAREHSPRKRLTPTPRRKIIKPMVRLDPDSAEEQRRRRLYRSVVLQSIMDLLAAAFRFIVGPMRLSKFIATVHGLTHKQPPSRKPPVDKDKT
ncbi:hypothetical protein ES705_41957 [subsurface metagenome]